MKLVQNTIGEVICMKNINIEDVKPLRNDPTKSQILIAVNFLEDAQKMRMAMGNRICASFRLEMNDAGDTSKDTKEEVDPEKEADAEEKKKVKIVKELVSEYKRVTDVYVSIFKGRGKIDKAIQQVPDNKYIKNAYDYMLIDGYNKLLETEDIAKDLVDKSVKEHPMWELFFKDIKGCGAVTAGRLIAKLDPHKARHASDFWAYCGIATRIAEDGSYVPMTKYNTIEVEYIDKNGNVAKKKSLGYNPKVQSILLGILVPSIIKVGKGSKYWKCYYDVKNRYQNRADLKEASKAHIHKMALRYVAKQILREMWVVWREYEGYQITAPYECEYLGYAPHEMNEYHLRRAIATGQFTEEQASNLRQYED